MKLSATQTIARDQLPEQLDINDEFKSAFDLMEYTKECLFITGKAGTGKSTLLKYFKANTGKNIIVLAPTGVAAINVGGQTIHSFFRLPPKIIQKEAIKRLRGKSLLENLDMIIIDEVSMVRADLMDGIDYALRLNRGRMKSPFG
ncbi:MAG: AAA family ATPase, partial [Candidatus Omnitrophica bacterium]|nr:AAA family ATPase [Candidatus Omnitrophota bacterium]